MPEGYLIVRVSTPVEGATTRTRCEFENEINEHKVQFVRIGDRNVNFIPC